MSTKTIFSGFRLWTNEQEEVWLRSLSEQGWQLEQVQPFGIYTFRRDVSAEYVYRLDTPLSQLRNRQNETRPLLDIEFFDESTYLQLFEDAGWRFVGERFGKRYFRQTALAGQTQELYSNVNDKVELYQRQLYVHAILLIVVMFCMLYPPPTDAMSVVVWSIPRAVVLAWIASPMLSVWQRLRQLRAQL